MCEVAIVATNPLTGFTAQKDDPVFPRRAPLAFPELTDRFNQSPKILRGDGFRIDEDDSAVIDALLEPAFEQGADGSMIVCDQGKAVFQCFRKEDFIGGAEELAVAPITKGRDPYAGKLPSHLLGHDRRNMLIQQE